MWPLKSSLIHVIPVYYNPPLIHPGGGNMLSLTFWMYAVLTGSGTKRETHNIHYIFSVLSIDFIWFCSELGFQVITPFFTLKHVLSRFYLRRVSRLTSYLDIFALNGQQTHTGVYIVKYLSEVFLMSLWSQNASFKSSITHDVHLVTAPSEASY